MKKIISDILKGGLPLLCLGMTVTSCNDFLDRKPLDQVSPSEYFKTADQLGTFTINYYTSIFPNNSGWFGGVATFDNGTDNQAARSGKIGDEVHGDKKANLEKALDTAYLAFEDGLYCIFINDEQTEKLDDSLNLKDGDILTFIRLTMLAGRMW